MTTQIVVVWRLCHSGGLDYRRGDVGFGVPTPRRLHSRAWSVSRSWKAQYSASATRKGHGIGWLARVVSRRCFQYSATCLSCSRVQVLGFGIGPGRSGGIDFFSRVVQLSMNGLKVLPRHAAVAQNPLSEVLDDQIPGWLTVPERDEFKIGPPFFC